MNLVIKENKQENAEESKGKKKQILKELRNVFGIVNTLKQNNNKITKTVTKPNKIKLGNIIFLVRTYVTQP